MFYLAASYLTKVLNVENMMWHFSESGHGKGAPDGVGGCLKRTADSLVGRGKHLSSLEILVSELTEACKGINIISINDQSFKEMDTFIPDNVQSFKGTLQVHQLVWHHTDPNIVHVRRLSCQTCPEFCEHYNLGKLVYEHGMLPGHRKEDDYMPYFSRAHDRFHYKDIYESDSDTSDDDIPLSKLNMPYFSPAHDRFHYKDIHGSDSDTSDDGIPLSKLNDTLRQYKENMFVVVKLLGKKISRHYVACILSLDPNKEYTVKFLKKTGTKSFEYPDTPEIAVIDEQDIQMVLNSPEYIEKKDEYIFKKLGFFPNLF